MTKEIYQDLLPLPKALVLASGKKPNKLAKYCQAWRETHINATANAPPERKKKAKIKKSKLSGFLQAFIQKTTSVSTLSRFLFYSCKLQIYLTLSWQRKHYFQIISFKEPMLEQTFFWNFDYSMLIFIICLLALTRLRMIPKLLWL